MDLSTKIYSNLDEVINSITTRITAHEEKLEKATSSANYSHSDITALSQDFQMFKRDVCRTLVLLKTQVELLSIGLDRHEAHLRRKVLLFHGITEVENDNPRNSVVHILKNQMDLPDISNKDLQVCHRLGMNKGKPRPVLVRFYDLHHRHQVWESKTALKDSGLVISEFLTVARHHTFLEARKHFGIKKCWTSDSKIIILLPDNTRCKIERMSDLQPLIVKYPGLGKPVETTSLKCDTKESTKSPRRPRRKH